MLLRILTYIVVSLQKPAKYIYIHNKFTWNSSYTSNIFKKPNANAINSSHLKNSSTSPNQSHSQVVVKKWISFRVILKAFAPVGFFYFALMQWRSTQSDDDIQVSHWQIRCYCALPLRAISRFWGWIADTNIPVVLRPWVYGFYSSTFGVNITEAKNSDFKSYPTLSDFFVRELKDGARVIDAESCLVSPCDGTVLHCGPVNGRIEEVKGVSYSLEKFLCGKPSSGDNSYCDSLLTNHVQSRLFQCIIYLAPGDYHRFHVPTNWSPYKRRHFAGELLSVKPSIVNWVPNLFTLNERATYIGQWDHGFFSFTAVGATNVGKIRVYMDDNLSTNRRKRDSCGEKSLTDEIKLKKGDLFGEFRMGSTIVLIFEAPSNFRFNVEMGQTVRMGESLGGFENKNYSNSVNKIYESDNVIVRTR